MGCTQTRQSLKRRRAVIAGIFERNGPEIALRQRLMLCATATECGRLCERLIKGPGKTQVTCVDPESGQQTSLYECLIDPEFQCPLRRF